MKKALNEIFGLTNKYIVLATPLILFSLLSSVYLTVTLSGNLIKLLCAISIFILMSGTFISGWFYMVKGAVTETQTNDPNMLIKDFPAGVGEYLLPSLGLMFNASVFIFAMLACGYFFGLKTIGDPNISGASFAKALEGTEALQRFMESLSTQQLVQLQHWNVLLLGIMMLCYFLLILYIPALFFKEKNPFKAVLVSLKDLFNNNFFKTLGIYLLIFVTNFLLSIVAALTGKSIILNFVTTLINFYYLILVAVGIFYYYYHNFTEQKLGQNIDLKI